ncbi:MAG: hypothetical protein KF773_31565 [Deltaproteobacteria bacterium]|nr:hypothetical protein [Deltaproteobacteria bacterium]MCW5802067.1 hypothetical protein [Deltaproteobacteria bacterium]
MRLHSTPILASFTLLAIAAPAFADDPPPADDPTQKTAPPTPQENLPAPVSTNDPAPPVASPDVTLPPGGVVSQAGIGGPVAYGRPGVLELGGSAGLMMAPDFRTVNFSPMIGWFVAENLELSAILGVSNIKANDEEATVWSAVIEPSYHLPFNRTTFGFMGLGVGAAYEHTLGTGLAIAPRIGANLLVGRSGVLTPSLSYEYTTHNVDRVSVGDMRDVTLLSVSSALRINVGYTAMW